MKELKDQNTDALDNLHITPIPEYATRSHPKGMPPLRRFALPVVVVMVVIVGFVFALKTITPLGKTGATPGSVATAQPIPPTRVTLEAHFGTTTATAVTTSHVSVPAGMKVTLTVIPDHSLTPFQTLTMGIYAQDPYPFSELTYCKYPYTATCTYVLAYSQSESTDYTKGTHTFIAFLGDISGSINQNSDPITVTWS